MGWYGLLDEVSFIPQTGKTNQSSYFKRAAATLPFGKVGGSFLLFQKRVKNDPSIWKTAWFCWQPYIAKYPWPPIAPPKNWRLEIVEMNYDIKRSGKRIRQLRIHLGYTQEMLAQELSIDRSFLSHVEAGKKGCSVDLLVQFSSVFGVSIDYLVLGTVQRGLSEAVNAEQLREGIESLICHLEEFSKNL